MNQTPIGWTMYSWNVFSGCERESTGCKFCYFIEDAENKSGTAAFPNGSELTIRPHKLLEPFQLKQPSLIFVNSTSDFAWEKVPDGLRDQIVDVMEATPQHQFQVLTKRPKELLRYSKRRKLPENFWAGVSIENQDYAWRADVLRTIDVDIRFLSLEPLLGPISLDYAGIHWIIVGGESGKHLSKTENMSRALVEKVDGKWQPRADRTDWVRQIRDGCCEAGVRLFFKQWGGIRPSSCGNTIDGRKWEEYPRLP